MNSFNQLDKECGKDCASGNLRKTTRVITQFYDKILKPSGLRSTQFSLLHHILLQNDISVSELSEILLMDQTTVTRNIEILRKKQYITVVKGEDDSRKKCITITKLGLNKLEEAIPYWKIAQAKIEQGIGKDGYNQFLNTLNYIQSLVE